jgi:hypothetical protein
VEKDQGSESMKENVVHDSDEVENKSENKKDERHETD